VRQLANQRYKNYLRENTNFLAFNAAHKSDIADIAGFSTYPRLSPFKSPLDVNVPPFGLGSSAKVKM
jgi:hypothetical protein